MAVFAAAARRPSTVERAFEIARLGTCASLPELAARLKREWHEAVDAHLAGPSIREELRRLLKASAAAASAASAPRRVRARVSAPVPA